VGFDRRAVIGRAQVGGQPPTWRGKPATAAAAARGASVTVRITWNDATLPATRTARMARNRLAFFIVTRFFFDKQGMPRFAAAATCST